MIKNETNAISPKSKISNSYFQFKFFDEFNQL